MRIGCLPKGQYCAQGRCSIVKMLHWYAALITGRAGFETKGRTMKNIVSKSVVLGALMTGGLVAGCAQMGSSSTPTADMPEVSDQRVCEIQRQWNRMSPDEQTAALNYHLRTLTRQYGQDDVEKLRARVRSARC
jgi:hypothetical protein